MKVILTCVDFSDLLAITLKSNKHHFEEVLVVTTKTDTKTHAVCKDNDVKFLATNGFYTPVGVSFNKFRALNEGVRLIERKGWMCVMDADIIWPHKIDWNFVAGNLYTPLRHMHKDLTQPIPDELQWEKIPVHQQLKEWAGYTQIFHWDDPVVPKGDLFQEWSSASGGDSVFQQQWTNKIRPKWKCLHLGDHCQWCGRTTKYLDGSVPKNAAKHSQQLAKLKLQRRTLRSLNQEIIRS